MGLIFNGNGDVIKAVDGSLTVEGLDIGGSTNIEAGIGTFSGNLNVGGVLTYEDVKNVDSVGIVTARDHINIVNDNKRLQIGAGQDLWLEHNGSNSKINNTTGTFYIQGDTISLAGNNGSHNLAVFTKTGSADLYFNNSKKFETTNTGVTVTGGVSISGSSTFTGNVFDFADSKQLRFGTGNDFEMFFNGTDQYLKAKAGKIRVQVNDGESSITCNVNAGVEIYYDDVKKFETYQYGVKSPGHIVASSDGYGFYAGVGFDIEMLHDGSNSRIKNITGDLEFQEHTSSGNIIFKTTTSGTERLRITSGGDIRQQWNDGNFFGSYYDSTYYMGFTFGATARTLYIDNRSNDTRADIVFRTKEGGAPEERLRIDSSGRVLIGTTTVGSGTADDLTIGNSSDHGGITIRTPNNKWGSIHFADGTSGGEQYRGQVSYDHSNDWMRFYVAQGERLRIKSDGFLESFGSASFVGAGSNYLRIGSSDAGGATLGLDGDSNGDGSGADYCMIQHATDGNLKIIADNPANAANIIFYSNSTTERMRITSAGNVLIGNTSGSEKLDVSGWIQSTSGFKTAGHPIATYASFTDISGGSYATRLGSTGSSTLRSTQIYGGGSHIATFDGVNTRLGIKVTAPGAPLHIGGPSEIRLDNAADAGNFARIQCFEESGNNHAILAFSVGAGEAIRIANDGRTYINTTSPIDGNSIVAIRGAFGASGCGVEIKHQGNQGSNRDFIRFYNVNSAEAGSIEHTSTTAVAFQTSSDHRLKENIADITDGIERLKLLKPRKFSWIDDPELGLRDGFIAHEVSPVIPHCVSGEKDAVKEDGSIQTQTMEYSQLTPLLTAALQEAIAEIETLKAEVAALKFS